MNRSLRIGLIGAGWVTQHHLQAWAALAPRVQVVAVADPSADRATERAARFGIAAVYPSAEAMLDAEALGAVDIASPREMHAQHVRLAADRGLPVLCQKPLAPTLAEAAALLRDVDGRTRLMVHENWRFRPYYRRIAQWLREGRIGRVLQAQMTLLSSGLLPAADGTLPLLVRQPFVAALDRLLVTEMLIHHIDTLRFLLGNLQLRWARLGKACAATAGEDSALLVFDAGTGSDDAAGTAKTGDRLRGASVGLIANLCVHGAPPGLVDRLLVVGSAGTIALDGGMLRCDGAEPASETFDVAASYQASYDATIAHFIDALANGTPFETAPDDNLQTLALVEAIYSSGGGR